MKRCILPNRRHGFLIATQFGGLDYTIQFGPSRSDPKEIFISCAKSGSASEAIARDAAILSSLALQYGVPFNVLRNAVTRDADGAAATIIGHALELISGEPGSPS
jgi:hypothetical protein